MLMHLHRSKKCTIQSWISIVRILNRNIYDTIYENAQTHLRDRGHNLNYGDLNSSQKHWLHNRNSWSLESLLATHIQLCKFCKYRSRQSNSKFKFKKVYCHKYINISNIRARTYVFCNNEGYWSKQMLIGPSMRCEVSWLPWWCHTMYDHYYFYHQSKITHNVLSAGKGLNRRVDDLT